MLLARRARRPLPSLRSSLALPVSGGGVVARWCSCRCGGGWVRLLAWVLFSPLGVFVVVVRSFVLVGGVSVFSFVGSLRSSVVFSGSLRFVWGCRPAGVRLVCPVLRRGGCAWPLVPVALFPRWSFVLVGRVSSWSFLVVGGRLWRVRSVSFCVASLRVSFFRRRVGLPVGLSSSSLRFPPAPVALFRPFGWPFVGVPFLASALGFSASGAGSALFLRSSPFLAAVSRGVCPVSLCLSVFRWPVRSAVLLCLLRVCAAPAVLPSVPRAVLVSFCRAGLASLGFSGAFLRVPPAVVLRFLGAFSLPALPRFSGVCRPRAVSAAFSSLASSLSWLCSSRGGRRGCPPACRGALAGLLVRVFRFLSVGV